MAKGPMGSLVGKLYFYLPRAVQVLCGKALGRLLGALGLRRKVVLFNLELTKLDKHPEILNRSYEALGQLILEILLLLAGPSQMRRFVNKYADLKGKEHWERAQSEGKGVIFLSSHLGNWELMLATGAAHGISAMMVTKQLKPAWIHKAIEIGRKHAGYDATYEPRTLKDILKRLSNKKTIGFVLDQYAGAPVGVRVPFMGVHVGTNTVIAMIAKRTGARVLPVTNFRTQEGRHHVEIYEALEWIVDPDPNREIALNTANYAKVLESHIKEHPDQWLWIHRRFKGELGPLQEGEWTQPRARS